MSLQYKYHFNFWAGTIIFKTISEERFRKFLLQLLCYRLRQRAGIEYYSRDIDAATINNLTLDRKYKS